MDLTLRCQAIMLLTSYFSNPQKGEPRPLSPREWSQFASWLYQNDLGPENLLSLNDSVDLSSFSDPKITPPRIKALLDRGKAMGISLSRWIKAGVWILDKSNPDYPKQLKSRLKNLAPPILFGMGNQEILQKPGMGIVGSRNAVEESLEFASKLGRSLGEKGLIAVSGGARGVDESSMFGALQNRGYSLGILSSSLLKTSLQKKWRSHLQSGHLALISTCYPEAGFTVARAMGRNKYIYCISEGVVVVQSGTTGGTWAGATENLRKGWVPLWVRPMEGRDLGNMALIQKGATILEQKPEHFDPPMRPVKPQQKELYPVNGKQKSLRWDKTRGFAKEDQRKDKIKEEKSAPLLENPPPISTNFSTFMEIFEKRLNLLFEEQKSLEERELVKNFSQKDLLPAQIKSWLGKLVKSQKIFLVKKRPKTYQKANSQEETEGKILEFFRENKVLPRSAIEDFLPTISNRETRRILQALEDKKNLKRVKNRPIVYELIG